ncbi:YxlC family protein [Bacillus sp. 31A1R]|uniref:YxlC family protein n=1 Tax=Robertmurraya mangrovi TaxID=3098077 RepID=A0ABU5ISP8_9BACI|nr:YxlC family protein [Bacillus sp. 31A1R]MDZ5470165.1 YxlC family protein [Bacillus sp. 31A1R]
MKNRKKYPLDHEAEEEFLDLFDELEEGFETLDKSFQIETPNMQFFEQMVANKQVELRKKLIKDISIFSIVALLVVSIVLYTLYQLPTVFYVLQGIVTIFIIGYTSRKVSQRVSVHE